MNEPVEQSPPLTVQYDGSSPLGRREISLYCGLQPKAPVCFADVGDAALPLPPGTDEPRRSHPLHLRSTHP